MNFLNKLLRKKEEPISTYADFWLWFRNHEKDFYKVVQNGQNIEKGFFDKLSPKLAELKEGYFYLTGMYDDKSVELVFTADGDIKHFVFIEELVEAAPQIAGWKFTALKPELKIEDVNISMAGYDFNAKNLHFYSNDRMEYPDEIDITIVHEDLTEENKQQLTNGIFIFLDNYLGELALVNDIDTIQVIASGQAEKELVPISKLKDFLKWRQKEFVEKYEGARHDTENDGHSTFEAELENRNTLIAVINTDLLRWDLKASHPWISILTLKFDGGQTNGMPSEAEYKLLDQIQDEILNELKDLDGYLNIGRQTANGETEIYFASTDFRKPSKVLYKIQQIHSASFQIEYEIYKDKYWQTFKRFRG